jgi:hypothetical protein
MDGHDEPLFGMRKTKYIIAKAKRGPFPDNKNEGRPRKASGKIHFGFKRNKKGPRRCIRRPHDRRRDLRRNGNDACQGRAVRGATGSLSGTVGVDAALEIIGPGRSEGVGCACVRLSGKP